jgi:hypothetical protein
MKKKTVAKSRIVLDIMPVALLSSFASLPPWLTHVNYTLYRGDTWTALRSLVSTHLDANPDASIFILCTKGELTDYGLTVILPLVQGRQVTIAMAEGREADKDKWAGVDVMCGPPAEMAIIAITK